MKSQRLFSYYSGAVKVSATRIIHDVLFIEMMRSYFRGIGSDRSRFLHETNGIFAPDKTFAISKQNIHRRQLRPYSRGKAKLAQCFFNVGPASQTILDIGITLLGVNIEVYILT